MSDRRRQTGRALLAMVATAAAALIAAGPAPAASPPVPSFRVVQHRQLSVGVEHELLRRDAPAEEVHVARLAPGHSDRLRVVLGFDVAGARERTSSMCIRRHCVVAVNGDFQEILDGGPVGGAVSGGELLRSPDRHHTQLLLDPAGRPTIGHDIPWSSSLVLDDGTSLTIDGVNIHRGADRLVAYTARRGGSTRTDADGRELVLALDGPLPVGEDTEVPVRMIDLLQGGDGPTGADRVVLSGNGRGQAALEELWHRVVTGAVPPTATLAMTAGGTGESIGGSPWLLRGGQRAFPDNPDGFTRQRHPRTVVGWTPAGETLLVTVDGRAPGHSEGMTLGEVADLLLQLGARDALNLDGGGSTTFAVGNQVRNRPSDPSGERAVVSALVVTLPHGITPARAAARSADPACPPGAVPEDGFADVPPDNAHEPAIDCAAWWRVAAGSGRGYGPSHPVTRAQLASFLARALERLGVALPAFPPNRFPDDDTSVHARRIDQLAAVGVVAGGSDGRYRPDRAVTRGQMATMLVRAHERAIGAPAPTSSDFFVDDVGDAHEGSINLAAAAGLSGGAPDGTYRPGAAVRRDQMASFLVRLLAAGVEAGRAATP